MKPIERLKQRANELYNAAVAARRTSREPLPMTDETHLQFQINAVHKAVGEALDALLAPPHYIVLPKDISQADAAVLAKSLDGQNATILPHGCGVVLGRSAPPIPCALAMPAPEQRVLAFVPGHEDPDRRWRVAAYTCPPLYLDTEWQDEESEVGDVGISWRLDQVTHWMPMPGEPT